MQAHPSGNQAGPSNSATSKYLVQTSDVIQDMRVNISEEGSEKVIWYKERFLGDEEIIDNVVHNPTSTILWTIHRPLRGWYIRIRSPAFPPGVFILLTPVPSTSALHADAALSFNTRTNMAPALPMSESQFTLQDTESESSSNTGTSSSSSMSSSTSSVASGSSSIHSYPPTPTTATAINSSAQPPTGYFDLTPSNSKTHKKPVRPPPSPRPSSQITQFLLSPTSIPPTHQPDPASTGFFARALSVLKNHRPSHSNSFTLSRVISPNGLMTTGPQPPPYASNVSVVPQASTAVLNPPPPPPPQQELHTPLLVFHDRTPVLTVRSLTGLIEMDKAEETCLGVDTSFWIAVALTYLEFLEERESYLAALSD